MEVLFLGTAASEGFPGLFCECHTCRLARLRGGRNIRTRASVLINRHYRIDWPPDSYMQSLREGLSLGDIRYVLVTHTHEDHFYERDFWLRGPAYVQPAPESWLEVWGDHWCVDALSSSSEVSEGMVRPLLLTENKPHRVGDATVVPLRAMHFPERGAFILAVTLHGKTLLYGLDSGFFPEETWERLACMQFDLVVLDCTHGLLPDTPYHMGIEGVLRTRDRLVRMGCTTTATLFVATHFSHLGGLLHDELEERLTPEGVLVAYDGMRVRL